MFEYVKDYCLEFSGDLVKRKNTNLIVLHHSEGGAAETARSIHDYHKSLGHKGIDYNICVQKDGAVVWGRGLEATGGHTMNKGKTAGVNARSVGIVCLGNFMQEKMGEAQKEALKKITADVVRHYRFGSISQIVTHAEIAGADYTDCPGVNFPADEVREFIRMGGTAQPAPEDRYIWKVTVGELNFRREADKRSDILAVLHRGDCVKLDRYMEGEDWARVTVNGCLGYVWLKYIGE